MQTEALERNTEYAACDLGNFGALNLRDNV